MDSALLCGPRERLNAMKWICPTLCSLQGLLTTAAALYLAPEFISNPLYLYALGGYSNCFYRWLSFIAWISSVCSAVFFYLALDSLLFYGQPEREKRQLVNKNLKSAFVLGIPFLAVVGYVSFWMAYHYFVIGCSGPCANL
jgi:hypothetical protein